MNNITDRLDLAAQCIEQIVVGDSVQQRRHGPW